MADDKCCAKGPDEGYTDRWNNARNPGVNKPAPSLEPALSPEPDRLTPMGGKRDPGVAAQINDRGSNLTPVGAFKGGDQPTRAEMVALTGGYTEPRRKPGTATPEPRTKGVRASANAEDREKLKAIAYARGGYTQRWSKARGG